MILDVRNMLFCKTIFQGNNDIYNILKNKDVCVNNFTTFGYYDSLTVYKVDLTDNNHILTKIENENIEILMNITPNLLIHPICGVLTKDTKITKKEINKFWSQQSIFFGCTSVYLNYNYSDIYNFTDMLKHNLNGIDYVVYKSLGYSDYLILWKTNDLKNVSEQIEGLKSINCVSYYNTIISVNNAYPNPEKEKYIIDQVSINIMSKPGKKTKPIVTAIENIFNLPCVKNSECCLKSNFDYSFTYDNVDVSKIVQFAKFINNNIANQASCGFLYLNTYIRNSCVEISKDVEICEDCEFYTTIRRAYENLKDEYIETVNNTNKYNDLFHATGQLINLLLNMSENRLYSSVCLLLFNSIKYIIKTFQFFIKKEKIENNDVVRMQKSFIQRLLRGCWTFVDSSLNQELSYVQELKYRPLITNVNVNMIEYYNGLFYKIAELLTTVDKKLEKTRTSTLDDEVYCLIVPKMCRRVKTYVHDAQQLNNLLFIDIPTSMIPDCLVSVESIVHEISHLWGDYYRCREYRKFCYFESVAVAVAYELLYSNYVSDGIYDILNLQIKECYYFDELKKRTLTELLNCISDDTFVAQLLSTTLKNLNEDEIREFDTVERLIYHFSESTTANRKTIISKNKIHTIVEDLYTLYKECYADIFMINLLDITTEEYLEMFKYEVNDKNNFGERCRLLIQRIVIVLLTLPEVYQQNMQELANKCRLYDEINNLLKYFIISKNNEDESKALSMLDTNKYYNADVISPLIDYLRKCFKTMEDSYSNKNYSNMRKEIQNVFNYIKDGKSIFSKQYYETLISFYDFFKEQLEISYNE